jgi:hypothetical protein
MTFWRRVKMARKKLTGYIGEAAEADRKKRGIDGRYNSPIEGAVAKDLGKHKKKK